jgi:uncharacterized membrane-anchored protein YitT (DUF2179 family)
MKLPENIHDILQDVFYMLAGTLIAGFALKSFLVPAQFLDGGVTGISLLIHEVFHVNLAYVIIIANIPLIIMGAIQINKKFAYRTFTCVVLLALCLEFIPYPVITHNELLVAVFGGFFMGIGIGLSMRSGCALDGIEVLALYTLKRSSLTISEIILGINAIIYYIAASHFGP